MEFLCINKLIMFVLIPDSNEKVIHFMMEYAAALIEYGEPSYALRFLAKADERNDVRYSI